MMIPISARQLVKDYLKKALPGYAPDGKLRPGVVSFGMNENDWLRREGIEDHLRAKKKILDNEYLRARASVSDGQKLTLEAESEVLEVIKTFYYQGRRDEQRLFADQDIVEKRRPLESAARIVADDLILLRQEGKNPAIMCAATVVFSFGQLYDKLGKTLEAIHNPVPGYHRWLKKPLDNFFQRLEPSKPFRRSNFELRWSGELIHPSLTSGHLDRKGQLEDIGDKENIHNIYLRAEIQTLRRLPHSNFILFTVDSLTDPISSILTHPTAAAALQSRLESLGHEMAQYKGVTPTIRENLIAALRTAAATTPRNTT
mmetsp:Transcript_16867/g.25388  ORF Transcript_16867/g.25388 Transcript_16867/m.25388 type:complete len:315 (-) Transcript_16867:921-1865(-)